MKKSSGLCMCNVNHLPHILKQNIYDTLGDIGLRSSQAIIRLGKKQKGKIERYRTRHK